MAKIIDVPVPALFTDNIQPRVLTAPEQIVTHTQIGAETGNADAGTDRVIKSSSKVETPRQSRPQRRLQRCGLDPLAKSFNSPLYLTLTP